MEIEEIISTLLKGAGYSSLFPHQRVIINTLYGTDNNVIIQSPTSSGKTLPVASYIYGEFLRGRSVVYTVPSKAMISDKINEMGDYFSSFERMPLIKKVGTDNAWRDANIIIGTFEEIYTAALRQNQLKSYSNIILDDFHVLYDKNRGYTLEKLVTYILTSEKMRMIALSATIAPLDILAEWLNKAETLRFGDEVRPVKLSHRSLFIDDVTKIQSMPEIFPCIVFCTTKKDTLSRCDKVSTFCRGRRISPKNNRRDLLSNYKGDSDNLDMEDMEMLDFLEYGIAYHNADLSRKTREWIEELYRQKRINILFTTSTLAYGINLPAKAVFIYDIHRWYASDNFLPTYEWKQMGGRAGRSGYQSEGIVYTCYKKEEDRFHIENRYYSGSIENVESSINQDDCFKKAILDLISINKGTESFLVDFFQNSLFMIYKGKSILKPEYDLIGAINRQLIELYNMEYIERRDPTSFVLTSFGRKVVDFLHGSYGAYFDTMHLSPDYSLQSIWVISERMKQHPVLSPREIIEIAIGLSESGSGYKPLCLTPSNAEVERAGEHVSDSIVDKETATIHVLLESFIENRDINQIFEEYGGRWAIHIKSLHKRIAVFLKFCNDLAIGNGVKIEGDMQDMIDRVNEGVTSNLLNVLRINTIGRDTAIRIDTYLSNLIAMEKKAPKYGTTPNLPKDFIRYFGDDITKSFKTMSPDRLGELLEGINNVGPKRIERILKAVFKDHKIRMGQKGLDIWKENFSTIEKGTLDVWKKEHKLNKHQIPIVSPGEIDMERSKNQGHQLLGGITETMKKNYKRSEKIMEADGRSRNTTPDAQKPKGYNKENHLASLHSLVDGIKKEWPDENVYVDEETTEVVWKKKTG